MTDANSKPKVEVGTWKEQTARPSFDPESSVKALEGLAWLLDNSIHLPGTQIRFGLDAILGLFPILGDAIGALISSFILITATKMGVPRVTLMRMAFNVAVDTVIGFIPFVGDIFDIGWKANLRNVQLLRAHTDNPSRAKQGDWFFTFLLITGVLGIFAGLGWLASLVF